MLQVASKVHAFCFWQGMAALPQGLEDLEEAAGNCYPQAEPMVEYGYAGTASDLEMSRSRIENGTIVATCLNFETGYH